MGSSLSAAGRTALSCSSMQAACGMPLSWLNNGTNERTGQGKGEEGGREVVGAVGFWGVSGRKNKPR